MKKIIITTSSIVFLVLVFGAGVYSGFFLSDYDVLCEKNYKAHKLQKEFKSKGGIILPKETIVYLRRCKPNGQAKLQFFIEKWGYEHTEILIEDPFPAYYLDANERDKK